MLFSAFSVLRELTLSGELIWEKVEEDSYKAEGFDPNITYELKKDTFFGYEFFAVSDTGYQNFARVSHFEVFLYPLLDDIFKSISS